MLLIKNVKTIEERVIDLKIESENDFLFDAKEQLIFIPALIDPWISIPKKDWKASAKTIIQSGITRIFDMPSNTLPCYDSLSLINKFSFVENELKEIDIPLRYSFFLAYDETYLEELGKLKKSIIGLKLETSLLNTIEKSEERAFQLAAQEDVILAVDVDSQQIDLLEKAISLAEKYGAQLIVSNVSTYEQIKIIKHAKKRELLIYCELSASSLFSKNNPDEEALWNAIHEETVDFLGAGLNFHHFLLPSLLQAYQEKKISMNKIITLTRTNIEQIFRLPRNQDFVLIDLQTKKAVYTILKGRLYPCL